MNNTNNLVFLQQSFSAPNNTKSFVMDIGEKVTKLRTMRGWTQGELAKAAGTKQQNIQQLEDGSVKRPRYLPELARALNVTVDSLVMQNEVLNVGGIEPRAPSDDEFAAVRRVNLKPSAGIVGYSIDLEPEDGKPIFFRRDFLSDKGWDAAKLIAQRVNGDSMEPSLFDDDLIVINTADQTPREGMVFVINYEGELVVKRLARNAGEWLLRSDNPDKRRYPDKVLDGHAIIIGRVVYRQSENI